MQSKPEEAIKAVPVIQPEIQQTQAPVVQPSTSYNPPLYNAHPLPRVGKRTTLLADLMCVGGALLALLGIILIIVAGVGISESNNCSSASCCAPDGTCFRPKRYNDCICCSGDHCRFCPASYTYVYDEPTCTAFDEYTNLLISAIIILILGPILLCCPICWALCFFFDRGMLVNP